MTHDEILKIYSAMKTYGGGFVKALAECFITADSENLRRLTETFPEIVAQYLAMTERRKKGDSTR